MIKGSYGGWIDRVKNAPTLAVVFFRPRHSDDPPVYLHVNLVREVVQSCRRKKLGEMVLICESGKFRVEWPLRNPLEVTLEALNAEIA